MESYLNIVLTLILIAIYWYNTKSQNEKIKAQSDIINDLREHVKFFDLQKIKEYVELRESEKDKLLEITKATIEKELEFKANNRSEKIDVDYLSEHIVNTYLLEPYIFIVKEMLPKTNKEIDEILKNEFPNNNLRLRNIITQAQKAMLEIETKEGNK